jgi:hypothetical protein
MGRKVKTHTQIVLGEGGRLNAARLKFDPYWGPLTLPSPVTQVVREIPLIGIFALYRLLSIEMDPKSRKITGKAVYLLVPIERDLQRGLAEAGKVPKDLVRGPGYDLKKGLPEYSWQITDIAEQMFLRKQTEGIKQIGQATGFDKIIPLFDQGRVLIEGDFSNEEIKIGKVTLKFSPKRSKDPHRIVLQGGMSQPKMKVWGLKTLEVEHAQGTLRIGHQQESEEPLELSWKLDYSELANSQVEIPKLDSQAFRIENVSKDPEQRVSFTLRRGLTVKNLSLSFPDGSPHLHIQEVEARQGEFEGLGMSFRSSPDDKATFSQVHMEIRNGFPHFHSRFKGEANGELDYKKDGEEVAWLKFRELKGNGSLRTGKDEAGHVFFRLGGDFSTQIPSLRLLVRSSIFKGSVRTEIGEALVKGRAELTVWPELGRARLSKLEGAPPLEIAGTSGQVRFHQDPSQVEAWPELKEQLGKLAEKVQTDLTIDLKDIGFEVNQMDVRRVFQAESKIPALEILEADISDIRIRGDLHGKLWARLPGGVFHPLTVPENAKMNDATVTLGSLRDFEKDGKREAIFQKIFISGEESNPTLNASDQKRCGFDRQHIHADLGLFGFSPDTKSVQIQKLGSHFHVYLKNPRYLGGCLKVD